MNPYYLGNSFLARFANSSQLANLKLSVSGPLLVTEHQQATYQVVVTNNGPSGASGVRIMAENFPTFSTPLSPLPGYASSCQNFILPAGTQLACDVPPLSVGDSAKIEFSGVTGFAFPPSYPVPIYVRSNMGNPTPADSMAFLAVTTVTDAKLLGMIQFLNSGQLPIVPDQLVATVSAPIPAYRLLNLGTQQPITLTKLTLGGSNASEFQLQGDCAVNLVLPIGGHCDINVIFAPNSVGYKLMQITVDSDSILGPRALIVNGSAVAPAVATVSAMEVAFGNYSVNSLSGAQTVQLTNSGIGRMKVSAIVANGDFGQSNDCPLPRIATLVSEESCTISIYFRPSLGGLRQGTLQILSNAANGTQTLALSGMGIGVTDPGLGFVGSMPHIAAQDVWTTTFTLVNKGTGTATSRLNFFGDPSGPLNLPLIFPQA
jgi:hypothetical protein